MAACTSTYPCQRLRCSGSNSASERKRSAALRLASLLVLRKRKGCDSRLICPEATLFACSVLPSTWNLLEISASLHSSSPSSDQWRMIHRQVLLSQVSCLHCCCTPVLSQRPEAALRSITRIRAVLCCEEDALL
ncbi:hypothetical protein XENOCAPTIV_004402 [Xenoophorus captivus]|uniref:Uncharacterized protein n=1 Tax=Xenoophorus captivus TaxID=1517983 RepID=A0ABV0QHC2_9TELE